MRNLKKFLALVLAMMMVFSLMITVNAASTFTDKGDIDDKYETAANVLTALEVFKGYTSSSGYIFNPTGKILRQEFATILYRIHSGDTAEENVDEAANIAAANKFSDVGTDKWFSGAVGYCVNNGLLKGYPDGKYYPTKEVTSAEVVVGLLRALGYGTDGEFEGDQFATQAVIFGGRANILNGVIAKEINNNSATRQMVAQLAFETLQSNMVVWKDGVGDYVGAGNKTITLGEARFGMKVVKNVDSNDDGTTDIEDLELDPDPFGRPDPTYVILVDDKVIYSENGAVATYDSGEFTGKDAANLLKVSSLSTGTGAEQGAKGNAHDAKKVNVYYNGGVVNDTASIKFYPDGGVGQTTGMWINDTQGMAGLEIEVYKHSCDKEENASCTIEFDIIVREAYLATIKSIDKDTGKITLTVHESGQATGKDFEVAKADNSIYKALTAFAKGDYLAVYLAPNWNNNLTDSSYIRDVAKLTKEKVEVSRVSIGTIKAKSSLITNKGNFVFANQAIRIKGATVQYTTADILGASGVELDSAILHLLNGVILLVEQGVATNEGYAYLYGVYTPATTPGGGTPDNWSDEDKTTPPTDTPDQGVGTAPTKVRMILEDGTDLREGVWAVDSASSPGLIAAVKTSTSGGSSNTWGGDGALVYYTYNEITKVYTLTGIAGVVQGKSSTGELELKKGVAKGTVPKSGTPTGLKVEYDDNTVFFVVHVGDDGILESFDVKTGIDNMETISVSDDTFVAAAKATSSSNSTGTAVTTANDCVTALLIESRSGITKGSYFIVASSAIPKTKMKNTNGVVQEVYTFNAVVDGEVTTVDVLAGVTSLKTGSGADKDHPNADGVTPGVLFVSSVTKYTSGIINSVSGDMTLTAAVAITAVTPVTDGNNITITASGVQTAYRAANVRVYEYNVTAGTVKEIDKSDITGSSNYTGGYAVIEDNALVALYVTK